jgi:cell division protein DivIC
LDFRPCASLLLWFEYSASLDKEEELKDEINKLKDPEYMARYAREKYLYSKDGELIIRIPDEDN